jgi:hypothetical protein
VNDLRERADDRKDYVPSRIAIRAPRRLLIPVPGQQFRPVLFLLSSGLIVSRRTRQKDARSCSSK